MANLQITRWTAIGLIGFLVGIGVGAAEPEDELKSATVLSFVRHSEWLRDSQEGPITIGVTGRSAMIDTLHRALDGKTANNRPIRIVHAKAAGDLRSCQVLYVATDNNNEVRQTLASLGASHALTIGEADRFLDYGGAVKLLIVDGHMSFEVSPAALDRAGVSISSKLLRYGQVKVRPPV
jgi:hypothetical protein